MLLTAIIESFHGIYNLEKIPTVNFPRRRRAAAIFI